MEGSPAQHSGSDVEQSVLTRYGEPTIESLRTRVEGGVSIIQRQLDELSANIPNLNPAQADAAMQAMIQMSEILNRLTQTD